MQLLMMAGLILGYFVSCSVLLKAVLPQSHGYLGNSVPLCRFGAIKVWVMGKRRIRIVWNVSLWNKINSAHSVQYLPLIAEYVSSEIYVGAGCGWWWWWRVCVCVCVEGWGGWGWGGMGGVSDQISHWLNMNIKKHVCMTQHWIKSRLRMLPETHLHVKWPIMKHDIVTYVSKYTYFEKVRGFCEKVRGLCQNILYKKQKAKCFEKMCGS